jgi:hypothetical protein
MSLMYSPYKSSVKSSGRILIIMGNPNGGERTMVYNSNGNSVFSYDRQTFILNDPMLHLRINSIPNRQYTRDGKIISWNQHAKIGTERNDMYIYVPEIQESFSEILSTVLKMYNHPDWIKINCCPMVNFKELLILKISELDKKIEHIEAFLESRNVLYELD